ncbi:orotidine 5'-phosphate decarboxylase / HUMPS family protein [Streptomyces sp. NPDC001135]
MSTISQWRLRAAFAARLSRMYGQEVPAYTIGVGDPVEEQVLRLARLAGKAGCHGVIASPQDVAALRGALGTDALIVAPGVTLPGDAPAGHARPGTPRAAIAAGASHATVGRTVTRAADPAAAFRVVRTGLAR